MSDIILGESVIEPQINVEETVLIIEEPVSVPVQVVEEPVPVVEEPIPVVEEPVSVPVPVVEEPVSVPVPVVEEPVSVPVPVVEEPVSVPVPVVEEPVSVPVQVVEEPVSVPVPVVEEPVSVPIPVVEEPVSVPVQVVEEPVSVPVQVVEEPVSVPVQVVEEPVSVPVPVVEEPVSIPVVEEKNILDPNTNEIIEQITQCTFHKIFEKTLEHESCKISPEIKEYVLLLCKENPLFFSDVEDSLKKIIVDDKINTKDIPDIIMLVGKIYEIISSKNNTIRVDPYEVIKILLQNIFVTYFNINNINNSELEANILHIISVSIQLIQMQSFKPSKKGCLSRLFNF